VLENVKVILEAVGSFFVLYMMTYSTFLLLSVVVGSSVLYRNKQMADLHNEIKQDYYYPVTIIVPAHNEEVTVVDTVRSLLQLDYKLYEIIVVDDGSNDLTAQKLIDAFDLRRVHRPLQRQIACQPEEYIFESQAQKVPVVLVRKKNGGKADALNMGINASRFPYFVCLDADSMLQADALEHIVRPALSDENMVACGGMVRIANGVILENGSVVDYHLPNNILICMQILEYDRSFMASRLLLDAFNGNLIISGAFGLFKKDIVIAAGGYDSSTLGEDMELVVKLHVFCRKYDIPYTIRYAADAICWSQAPATLNDLRKQRRRWHLGLFQSMWKHRQILLNPEFGVLSYFSFLYFLFYELLSPYIELFGLITVASAFALNLINLSFMIWFFAVYAVFGAVLTMTAFFARIYTQNAKLSFSDVVKALLLCLLENIGLRLLIAFVRMTAFIGYRKNKMQWGKITRSKLNRI